MKIIKNKSIVLLVGAGNLGARHLQGLASSSNLLRIFVLDSNLDALQAAQKRWLDAIGTNKTKKLVTFHTELGDAPSVVDLVIIATTAHRRVDLVRALKKHALIRYWVFEKILTQSALELDQLLLVLGSETQAWVNTPRRMLTWHKLIRNHLTKQKPLHLRVGGKAWGLACNSIHFLDMLAWFSGEMLTHISTVGLAKKWIESKRPGNWEIMGKFEAHFSRGSTATVTVEQGDPVDLSYQFRIEDGDLFWSIDEENGTAIRSDGLSVPGRLPFQSEVTPLLVDEILSTGKCELPSLEISAETHRVFLDAMLMHWKKTVDASATTVPIT